MAAIRLRVEVRKERGMAVMLCETVVIIVFFWWGGGGGIVGNKNDNV